MPIIYIGAYTGRAPQLGSLVVLLSLGLLGFFMKLLRWPRPPLLLAFVLGALIEKNLFISVQAYGAAWLLRPITLVLGFITIGFICYSIILFKRKTKRKYTKKSRFSLENSLFLIPAAIAAFAVIEARSWPQAARLFPWVIGWATIFLSLAEFIHLSFQVKGSAKDEILDLPLDLDVSGKELTKRAVLTFCWLLGILGGIHLLGFRIALPLFTLSYLKFQGKANWFLTVGLTVLTGIICIVLFEQILQIIWPNPLIKLLFPKGFWPF
jgi:hypothetical protein